MHKIDHLVNLRAKTLLFSAFSMGLWQFSWIAQDVFQESGGIRYQISGWLTVIGALCWVVAAYFIHSYSKKVKHEQACKVLNDELTQRNRSRAFIWGYASMMILIWLLIPATDFWEFKVKFAVRVIATVGIILPMAYFAYLELKQFKGSD